MKTQNIQEPIPRENGTLGSKPSPEVNGHGPSASYSTNGHTNGFVNGNLDHSPKKPNSLKSMANGHTEGENVTENPARVRLYLLSCFDQKGGRSQAKSLSEYLVDRLHGADDRFLDDLAYTLGERRSRFDYKAVVAANSVSQLIEGLDDESLKFKGPSGKKALAYIFTGQGAQWYAMGRELMWAYPVFYKSLVRARECLSALGAPWNLIGKTMPQQKNPPANMKL